MVPCSSHGPVGDTACGTDAPMRRRDGATGTLPCWLLRTVDIWKASLVFCLLRVWWVYLEGFTLSSRLMPSTCCEGQPGWRTPDLKTKALWEAAARYTSPCPTACLPSERVKFQGEAGLQREGQRPAERTSASSPGALGAKAGLARERRLPPCQGATLGFLRLPGRKHSPSETCTPGPASAQKGLPGLPLVVCRTCPKPPPTQNAGQLSLRAARGPSSTALGAPPGCRGTSRDLPEFQGCGCGVHSTRGARGSRIARGSGVSPRNRKPAFAGWPHGLVWAALG